MKSGEHCPTETEDKHELYKHRVHLSTSCYPLSGHLRKCRYELQLPLTELKQMGFFDWTNALCNTIDRQISVKLLAQQSLISRSLASHLSDIVSYCEWLKDAISSDHLKVCCSQSKICALFSEVAKELISSHIYMHSHCHGIYLSIYLFI